MNKLIFSTILVSATVALSLPSSSHAEDSIYECSGLARKTVENWTINGQSTNLTDKTPIFTEERNDDEGTTIFLYTYRVVTAGLPYYVTVRVKGDCSSAVAYEEYDVME